MNAAAPAANILIVDDEIQNRKLLELLLRPEGYLTQSAANGGDALAMIAVRAPDLILLDVMMPELDGYEVARRLKSDAATANIPIIMVTAKTDRDSRLAGLAAGAEEFLTKPVDRAELYLRVRNLLRLKAIDDFLRDQSVILERLVRERTAELHGAAELLRQEITERKKSEAEQRRLANILQSTTDLVSINSPVGQLVYLNRAGREMLGVGPDEDITQLTIADFVPADALRAILAEGVPTAIREGVWSGEGTLSSRKGAVIPVSQVILSHKGSDDKVEFMSTIMRDLTDSKKAEAALLHERDLLHGLMDSVPDFIYFKDRDLRYIRINKAMAAHVRLASPDSAVGRRAGDLYPEEAARIIELPERQMLEGGGPIIDDPMKGVAPDGRPIWRSRTEVPIRDKMGAITALVGITRDITARHEAEEQVRRLNRVHAVLSGINSLIVRVRDREELFRETCRLAVEAGGFVAADVLVVDPASMRITLVDSSSTRAPYLEQLRAFLAEPYSSWQAHYDRLYVQRQALVMNDLDSLPAAQVDGGLYAGVLSVCFLPLVIGDQTIGVLTLRASEADFFDAAEIKLLMELAGDIAFALDHIDKGEKLDYLAYYDQLTGLANATLFQERLKQYLSVAKDGQQIGLALFDVERFKTLNDALGRPAGDLLLKEVAARLALCLGGPEELAHLGADHFAVVLPNIAGEREAARFIESCIESCFGETFRVADNDIKAAARVGIALYPMDGTDPGALLRNAEAALTQAKTAGDRYLFYSRKMNARVVEQLSLENRLRQALEREQFVLHYQPKVSSSSGHMSGVEALIRWNDSDNGLIPPGQFIPLLEETGLIREVGAWALRQAVCDHGRWLEAGLAAPRVAVNVSAIQLRQADFVEVVRRSLERGPGPPGIDLEITESLIMNDIEANIAKLKALRAMGLGIAVDDFGTGHSSLAYLARLPVHTLKIDRCFIVAMLNDSNTMSLVSTIISLAHSLGLTVVAEGVELEAQASALRVLRCDQMQGFLFSKPVPFEAISTLLKYGPADRRGRHLASVASL